MIGTNAVVAARWPDSNSTVPEIRWFTINLKNTQLSDGSQDKTRELVSPSFAQASASCTLAFAEPYDTIAPFLMAGVLIVVWAVGAGSAPKYHGKEGRGSAGVDIAGSRGPSPPHWVIGVIGAVTVGLVAAAWRQRRKRCRCSASCLSRRSSS